MVLSYLSLCLSANDSELVPPLQETGWIVEHATGYIYRNIKWIWGGVLYNFLIIKSI